MTGCCHNTQTYPDGTQPNYPANSQEDCPFGWYSEEPCASCRLVATIDEVMSEEYPDDRVAQNLHRSTITTIFDVRYFLLVNSALGRQLLALYREHGERLFAGLQGDADLRRDTVAYVLKLTGAAQDMLRLHLLDRDAKIARGRGFDEATLDEGRALLVRMQAASRDPRTAEAVSALEALGRRFVGLTTEQTLDLLDPVPTTRSRHTAPPEA